MTRVRLHGTPAEVAALAALLRATVTVLSESSDYPDRGASVYVRRYLDVELPEGATLDITVTRSAPDIRVERLSLPGKT